LITGGDRMAFPALAADAEASAIRTRAFGETGRESSRASGGGEVFFPGAGFFRALDLRETFLLSTGGGAAALPAGGPPAGWAIGDEMGSSGSRSPDEDMGMRKP
jgi:hypothetical protein